MNKSSKTLFTFLMLLGASAYSKEGLISVDVLRESKIDPVIVNLLLADNVLLKSQDLCYYKLNDRKVREILSKNSAPELVEFMEWLKSIVGEETQVNEKDPGNMTPSSQDIKA